MRTASSFVLLAAIFAASNHAESFREVVYGGVATIGEQIVPLYDKGFLIYLHRPNRLQVFHPDTQPAFDFELSCPGTGPCSASGVAVDAHGNTAIGFGYWTERGRAGGIRILNPQGQQTRFIETSLYVPTTLSFDRNGDLWTLGWQRDSLRVDYETKDEYSLVLKFSAEGKLVGQYLPRSLWPGNKSNPGAGGRGYWQMYAASERIGAILHESHADNSPEWVEWDLTGKLISRTILDSRLSAGRAFTANGRLYARFHTIDSQRPELKVLDTAKGTWTAVHDNLPDQIKRQGVFLLGADGDDLVYRVGSGNVRLVWAQPGVK
jgi:YD repeat-containing protein